jgi:hypothetical protein
MEKDTKKVKKKKSKTTILRKLKESRDLWKEMHEEMSDKYYKLLGIHREIQKTFPKKYFKIKFKIMADDKNIYEYEEIIEDYSLNMAIKELKSNKIYPDTFELIDVKTLN